MGDGMKLSFSLFMRIYSVFSVLFFIFGALAVVIGGPALFVSYEWSDPEVESFVFVFRVVIVLLFGTGFVISSLFFLVTRRRGLSSYKRIIDRLSSERSMSFNLNIQFPEQDEFGDLGRWLNKFVSRMREFDRIKVERLRALQQKLAAIAEIVDKGILFVSNENRITFVNKAFIRLMNIGEKSVVGLPLNRVIESEEIGLALEEFEKKPKNRTLEDLRIRSGDSWYKAVVDMVPIISPDVDLLETMIVFNNIQKKRI